MRLKELAEHAFHASGALAWTRHRNRDYTRILMYHRFPERHAAAFEQQCRYMAKHYSPVSLTDFADARDKGTKLPANALIVTIDDGYLDVYTNAFPALAKHRIPATVFLMTGFLDGLTWPWWDQLRYSLEHSPHTGATLAIGSGAPFAVPLESPAQREAAVHDVCERLTLVPNAERLAFLDRLPGRLAVNAPATAPPGFRPMTWDQVREMSRAGIDFGAHTVTHPILSRLDAPQMREEMEQSRDRIAQELGSPPPHFCYPSGRSGDLDERARSAAVAARFRTAVTTQYGMNRSRADPLLLKRIGLEPESPPLYFERQLAGVRVPV